ncbi:MAG: glycosyltransferase [Coriobacteriaceae bacterium]|nr:MAG: glycosyltransferase [Coriobacteriaceae bacterium]
MGGQIFVLPSLRESGGNVLVEAAAHKLPIVALDMSLSHIFNKHHCGLFINTDQSKEEIIKQFATCLERLILDPELRIELGENGYEFVNEKMTWDHMMQVVYGGNNSAF